MGAFNFIIYASQFTHTSPITTTLDLLDYFQVEGLVNCPVSSSNIFGN